MKVECIYKRTKRHQTMIFFIYLLNLLTNNMILKNEADTVSHLLIFWSDYFSQACCGKRFFRYNDFYHVCQAFIPIKNIFFWKKVSKIVSGEIREILMVIELLASEVHFRKTLFRIDLNQEPYINIHKERKSVLRN